MLHVGALRDALFKELFARHSGGVNILRIEDTDRTRYDPNSEAEFIETLRWAGIEFDEGPHVGGPFAPYRQSERKAAGIYQPLVEELLAKGGAYKAFDTPEELDEMRLTQQINKRPTGYFGGQWREASPEKVAEAEAQGKPFVIRQKVRRGQKIVIEDLIRGRIEWDSDLVDDPVLIKVDGMPTYHFASMVDDHLMEVTHIMRGEEWISSAPKHAELFDLFGWERPVFVHLPVIVGADGKKLSKRHGATRVLDYASLGYLPEAIINFIALIGWSPKDNLELLSKDELISLFDLSGLQPSPGRFDMEKLDWINASKLRAMPVSRLAEVIADYWENETTRAFWDEFVPEPNTALAKVSPERVRSGMDLLSKAIRSNIDLAEKAIALEQERVKTLPEFGEACAFFFEEAFEIDPAAGRKWLKPEAGPMLLELAAKIEAESMLDEAASERILRGQQEAMGLEKLGPVVHPTRVALTGRTFGPGLWELMAVLGRDRTAARLRAAEARIGAGF